MKAFGGEHSKGVRLYDLAERTDPDDDVALLDGSELPTSRQATHAIPFTWGGPRRLRLLVGVLFCVLGVVGGAVFYTRRQAKLSDGPTNTLKQSESFAACPVVEEGLSAEPWSCAPARRAPSGNNTDCDEHSDRNGNPCFTLSTCDFGNNTQSTRLAAFAAGKTK